MIYILGLIGLALRLYTGWSFLASGLEKLNTGFGAAAVTGYLKGALGKTSASLLATQGPVAAGHPDVTATWAWVIQHIFLPNAGLFAFLVKFGEVAVGIALILGLFTHLAAGAGMFMSFVFLLSGTASITGPLILSFLVIFWIGAGSYFFGIDRFFMDSLVKQYPKLTAEGVHTFFPSPAHKKTRNKP